eukprot:9440389-Alexandrium_andersonii.AAC.1
MSASLVGSEMCIRDSHWSGTRGSDIDLSWTLPPRWVKSTKFGRLAYSRCLLYTSDAADDM